MQAPKSARGVREYREEPTAGEVNQENKNGGVGVGEHDRCQV